MIARGADAEIDLERIDDGDGLFDSQPVLVGSPVTSAKRVTSTLPSGRSRSCGGKVDGRIRVKMNLQLSALE